MLLRNSTLPVHQRIMLRIRFSFLLHYIQSFRSILKIRSILYINDRINSDYIDVTLLIPKRFSAMYRTYSIQFDRRILFIALNWKKRMLTLYCHCSRKCSFPWQYELGLRNIHNDIYTDYTPFRQIFTAVFFIAANVVHKAIQACWLQSWIDYRKNC